MPRRVDFPAPDAPSMRVFSGPHLEVDVREDGASRPGLGHTHDVEDGTVHASACSAAWTSRVAMRWTAGSVVRSPSPIEATAMRSVMPGLNWTSSPEGAYGR